MGTVALYLLAYAVCYHHTWVWLQLLVPSLAPTRPDMLLVPVVSSVPRHQGPAAHTGRTPYATDHRF